MNETKEIFSKMDRQEELRSRLVLAIPELLTVDQWKTYVRYLKKNQKMLLDTLNSIALQNVSQQSVITTEREARYHLFNFYSCAYCVRQTMYEGKHFSKGSAEFDKLVNDWKGEFIPRIAIAIRNKYQHGSLMEHVLHYEFRTKHHELGEGFAVGYNFEPSTWNKIVDEVQGAEAREHLKTLIATHTVDPISIINSEFIQSCDAVCDKIEELFERVFAEELAKKQALKNEFDEIEKWFEDRGMYSV